MSGDILNDGLSLMVFGMGTVFAFLTLLVIATTIMSMIICKYFPEVLAQKSTRASTQNGNEPQIVSAIMAAIKLHRSKKQ